MKKANKILEEAGIIHEATIKAGKDLYINIKIGDTIVDDSGDEILGNTALSLNGKVLEKNGNGYSLMGITKFTKKNFDIFISKKELEYIVKNWKSIK